MANLIYCCYDDTTVISLRKGEYFFVHNRIPFGVSDLIDQVADEEGAIWKITAKVDLVAHVNKLSKATNGAYHSCRDILFLRNNHGTKQLSFVDNGNKFTKDEMAAIRRFLVNSDTEVSIAIDGFVGGALIYDNEVGIFDARNCHQGWIIKITTARSILEIISGNVKNDEQLKATTEATKTIEPTIDPVAEAEAELARASAKLEAVKQAAAIKALVDNAAAKHATAIEARKVADQAITDVEEAKKALSVKKATAKAATEAAEAAEEAAVAAEAAAEAAKTTVPPAA